MNLAFPSRAFDEAVAALCHGQATDEQARDLHNLLRHDPAARDEYLLRVELHSRLASDPDRFAWAAREVPTPVGPDTRIEFPPQLRTVRSAVRPWVRQRNRVLALAAGLALLLSRRRVAASRLVWGSPGRAAPSPC